MHTYTSLGEVPRPARGSAVTIGKFDGVHAGHRRVATELRDVAADRTLTTAVVTFDRHPLALLDPESCPPPLLSPAQKLERIAELGVDLTVMLTFDEALSALPAEEFVRAILVDTLDARVVLVGRDFRFGAGGRGDVELLRELGRDSGFEVGVVDDVLVEGGRRVSSTWIRELLGEGEVVRAAELLGYQPTIRSTVVGGEQRGRTLGYPTANLAAATMEGLIPADGVYAAWFTVGDDVFGAAVSIGNNPTFEGVPPKQVEAHLLDQQLDLYGRTASISFAQYIRGMRKFPGATELAEQMTRDEEIIRGVLGVPRPVTL